MPIVGHVLSHPVRLAHWGLKVLCIVGSLTVRTLFFIVRNRQWTWTRKWTSGIRTEHTANTRCRQHLSVQHADRHGLDNVTDVRWRCKKKPRPNPKHQQSTPQQRHFACASIIACTSQRRFLSVKQHRRSSATASRGHPESQPSTSLTTSGSHPAPFNSAREQLSVACVTGVWYCLST